MNTYTPFMTRFIATLTAVFFLFSSVSPSLTAAIRPDENALLSPSAADYLISSSLGKATRGETGEGNGRLVVLIQDLHCHPEVQRNITSILESLSSRYAISRVFLEGASGTVDLSWYDTITEPQLKNAFIETLMAQGKLSGATYFGLKHPDYANKLFGLENKELHAQNLVRLSRIMDSQAETARILARARESLERTKKEYFSERHRRLDTVVREYRAGRMTAEKYYALLTNLSRKADIDINGYKNIAVYQRVREQEQHINYRLAGHELHRLMAALRDQLPYNEYRALTEKAGHPSSQDELLDALAIAAERHQLYFDREVGAGLSPLNRFACKSKGGFSLRGIPSARAEAHALPAFPHLGRLMECRSLSRALDPLAMITEEKYLVRDLRNRFSANKHERAVGFIADYFNCLEDCLNAKLTSDDYAWFTSQYNRFARQWVSYVGDETYAELEPSLSELRAFYEVNLERNQTFLSAITANGMYAAASSSAPAVPAVQSSSPRPVDVVVMGGFHTEGMSRLLKEQGIQYVMITPHVTRSAAFSDNVYRRLIEEQGKLLAETINLLENSQARPIGKAWVAASVMVPLLMNSGCGPEQVVSHMTTLLKRGVNSETSLTVRSIGEDNKTVNFELIVDKKIMTFQCDRKGKNRWELKKNEESLKIAGEYPESHKVLECLRQFITPSLRQSHDMGITMLCYNAYALALSITGIEAGSKIAINVSQVIMEAFKKKSMILKDDLYREEKALIAKAAARTMGIEENEVEDKFEVRVTRNKELVSGDAWALSAMEWDKERGKYVIYVHEEFIIGVPGKSDEEKTDLLETLGEHEGYEYDGVIGVDQGRTVTSIGKLFRDHTGSIFGSNAGSHLTIDEFHSFLRTSEGVPVSIKQRQNKLFSFAEAVARRHTAEHIHILTVDQILERLEELSKEGYNFGVKRAARSHYKRYVLKNWKDNKKLLTKEIIQAVETLSKMEPGSIGLMYAFGSINEQQRDVLMSAAQSQQGVDDLEEAPEVTELYSVLLELCNSYRESPYNKNYMRRLIPCSKEIELFLLSHKKRKTDGCRELIMSSTLGLDMLSQKTDQEASSFDIGAQLSLPDAHNTSITMLCHNAYALALYITGIEAGSKIAINVSQVIMDAFKKKSMLLNDDLYREEKTLIANAAARTMGIKENEVEEKFGVKVSRNKELFAKDAWALAAMEWDSERGKYIIYVHQEFFNGLYGKTEEEIVLLLQGLGEHEALDQDAVVGYKNGQAVTSVGQEFRKYLESMHVSGNETRDSDSFHEWLHKKFSQNDENDPVIVHQKALFDYAESVTRWYIFCTEIRAGSDFYPYSRYPVVAKIVAERLVQKFIDEGMDQLLAERTANAIISMKAGSIERMYAAGSLNKDQQDFLLEVVEVIREGNERYQNTSRYAAKLTRIQNEIDEKITETKIVDSGLAYSMKTLTEQYRGLDAKEKEMMMKCLLPLEKVLRYCKEYDLELKMVLVYADFHQWIPATSRIVERVWTIFPSASYGVIWWMIARKSASHIQEMLSSPIEFMEMIRLDRHLNKVAKGFIFWEAPSDTGYFAILKEEIGNIIGLKEDEIAVFSSNNEKLLSGFNVVPATFDRHKNGKYRLEIHKDFLRSLDNESLEDQMKIHKQLACYLAIEHLGLDENNGNRVIIEFNSYKRKVLDGTQPIGSSRKLFYKFFMHLISTNENKSIIPVSLHSPEKLFEHVHNALFRDKPYDLFACLDDLSGSDTIFNFSNVANFGGRLTVVGEALLSVYQEALEKEAKNVNIEGMDIETSVFAKALVRATFEDIMIAEISGGISKRQRDAIIAINSKAQEIYERVGTKRKSLETKESIYWELKGVADVHQLASLGLMNSLKPVLMYAHNNRRGKNSKNLRGSSENDFVLGLIEHLIFPETVTLLTRYFDMSVSQCHYIISRRHLCFRFMMRAMPLVEKYELKIGGRFNAWELLCGMGIVHSRVSSWYEKALMCASANCGAKEWLNIIKSALPERLDEYIQLLSADSAAFERQVISVFRDHFYVDIEAVEMKIETKAPSKDELQKSNALRSITTVQLVIQEDMELLKKQSEMFSLSIDDAGVAHLTLHKAFLTELKYYPPDQRAGLLSAAIEHAVKEFCALNRKDTGIYQEYSSWLSLPAQEQAGMERTAPEFHEYLKTLNDTDFGKEQAELMEYAWFSAVSAQYDALVETFPDFGLTDGHFPEQRFWQVKDELANIIGGDESEVIAEKLISMKPGLLELLRIFGVIDEEQRKALAEQSVAALKGLSEESKTKLSLSLNAVVASYPAKMDTQQNRMKRFLLPYDLTISFCMRKFSVTANTNKALYMLSYPFSNYAPKIFLNYMYNNRLLRAAGEGIQRLFPSLIDTDLHGTAVQKWELLLREEACAHEKPVSSLNKVEKLLCQQVEKAVIPLLKPAHRSIQTHVVASGALAYYDAWVAGFFIVRPDLSGLDMYLTEEFCAVLQECENDIERKKYIDAFVKKTLKGYTVHYEKNSPLNTIMGEYVKAHHEETLRKRRSMPRDENQPRIFTDYRFDERLFLFVGDTISRVYPELEKMKTDSPSFVQKARDLLWKDLSAKRVPDDELTEKEKSVVSLIRNKYRSILINTDTEVEVQAVNAYELKKKAVNFAGAAYPRRDGPHHILINRELLSVLADMTENQQQQEISLLFGWMLSGYEWQGADPVPFRTYLQYLEKIQLSKNHERAVDDGRNREIKRQLEEDLVREKERKEIEEARKERKRLNAAKKARRTETNTQEEESNVDMQLEKYGVRTLSDKQIEERLKYIAARGYKLGGRRTRFIFEGDCSPEDAIIKNWETNGKTVTKGMEAIVEAMVKDYPGSLGAMYPFGVLDKRQFEALEKAGRSAKGVSDLENKVCILELFGVVRTLDQVYNGTSYGDFFRQRLIPPTKRNIEYILSQANSSDDNGINAILQISKEELAVLAEPDYSLEKEVTPFSYYTENRHGTTIDKHGGWWITMLAKNTAQLAATLTGIEVVQIMATRVIQEYLETNSEDISEFGSLTAEDKNTVKLIEKELRSALGRATPVRVRSDDKLINAKNNCWLMLFLNPDGVADIHTALIKGFRGKTVEEKIRLARLLAVHEHFERAALSDPKTPYGRAFNAFLTRTYPGRENEKRTIDAFHEYIDEVLSRSPESLEDAEQKLQGQEELNVFAREQVERFSRYHAIHEQLQALSEEQLEFGLSRANLTKEKQEFYTALIKMFTEDDISNAGQKGISPVDAVTIANTCVRAEKGTLRVARIFGVITDKQEEILNSKDIAKLSYPDMADFVTRMKTLCNPVEGSFTSPQKKEFLKQLLSAEVTEYISYTYGKNESSAKKAVIKRPRWAVTIDTRMEKMRELMEQYTYLSPSFAEIVVNSVISENVDEWMSNADTWIQKNITEADGVANAVRIVLMYGFQKSADNSGGMTVREFPALREKARRLVREKNYSLRDAWKLVIAKGGDESLDNLPVRRKKIEGPDRKNVRKEAVNPGNNRLTTLNDIEVNASWRSNKKLNVGVFRGRIVTPRYVVYEKEKVNLPGFHRHRMIKEKDGNATSFKSMPDTERANWEDDGEFAVEIGIIRETGQCGRIRVSKGGEDIGASMDQGKNGESALTVHETVFEAVNDARLMRAVNNKGIFGAVRDGLLEQIPSYAQSKYEALSCPRTAMYAMFTRYQVENGRVTRNAAAFDAWVGHCALSLNSGEKKYPIGDKVASFAPLVKLILWKSWDKEISSGEYRKHPRVTNEYFEFLSCRYDMPVKVIAQAAGSHSEIVTILEKARRAAEKAGALGKERGPAMVLYLRNEFPRVNRFVDRRNAMIAAFVAANPSLAERLAEPMMLYVTDADETILHNGYPVEEPLVRAYEKIFSLSPDSELSIISGGEMERLRSNVVTWFSHPIRLFCNGGSVGYDPGKYHSACYYQPLTQASEEHSRLEQIVRESIKKAGFDPSAIELYSATGQLTIVLMEQSPEKRARIAACLTPALDQAFGGEIKAAVTSMTIEIFRMDKGDALRHNIDEIAKQRGIESSEVLRETMAFGDSGNDIPMLNMVAEGGGVAVHVGGPIEGLSDKVYRLPVKNSGGTAAFLQYHGQAIESNRIKALVALSYNFSGIKWLAGVSCSLAEALEEFIVEDTSRYEQEIRTITLEAERINGKNNTVTVKVINKQDLIQKDAWALAITEINTSGEIVIYVSEEFLFWLKGRPRKERRELSLLLARHEIYELMAITDAAKESPVTPIGKSFRNYLLESPGGVPANIAPDLFHNFLKEVPHNNIGKKVKMDLANHSALIEYAESIVSVEKLESKIQMAAVLNDPSLSFKVEKRGISNSSQIVSGVIYDAIKRGDSEDADALKIADVLARSGNGNIALLHAAGEISRSQLNAIVAIKSEAKTGLEPGLEPHQKVLSNSGLMGTLLPFIDYWSDVSSGKTESSFINHLLTQNAVAFICGHYGITQGVFNSIIRRKSDYPGFIKESIPVIEDLKEKIGGRYNALNAVIAHSNPIEWYEKVILGHPELQRIGSANSKEWYDIIHGKIPETMPGPEDPSGSEAIERFRMSDDVTEYEDYRKYLKIFSNEIKKCGCEYADVRVSDDPALITPETWNLFAAEGDGKGGLRIYIHDAVMLYLIEYDKSNVSDPYYVAMESRKILEWLAAETMREYKSKVTADDIVFPTKELLQTAPVENSEFAEACVSEYLTMKAKSPSMQLGAVEIIKRLNIMSEKGYEFGFYTNRKIETTEKSNSTGERFRKYLLKGFIFGEKESVNDRRASVKDSKANQFAERIFKMKRGSYELMYAFGVVNEKQKEIILDAQEAKSNTDFEPVQSQPMGKLYETLTKMNQVRTLRRGGNELLKSQKEVLKRLIPADPWTMRLIRKHSAIPGRFEAQSAFGLRELKPQDAGMVALSHNLSAIEALANASCTLAEMFLASLVEDTSSYAQEIKTIKGEAERNLKSIFHKKIAVRIEVGNDQGLIQKDAWALATTVITESGECVIYVHDEFLFWLKGKPEAERKKLLVLLARHEMYELMAITDAAKKNPVTPIGKMFRNYLFSRPEGMPANIVPDDFHAFLEQEEKEIIKIVPEMAGHSALVDYANSIAAIDKLQKDKMAAVLNDPSLSFGMAKGKLSVTSQIVRDIIYDAIKQGKGYDAAASQIAYALARMGNGNIKLLFESEEISLDQYNAINAIKDKEISRSDPDLILKQDALSNSGLRVTLLPFLDFWSNIGSERKKLSLINHLLTQNTVAFICGHYGITQGIFNSIIQKHSDYPKFINERILVAEKMKEKIGGFYNALSAVIDHSDAEKWLESAILEHPELISANSKTWYDFIHGKIPEAMPDSEVIARFRESDITDKVLMNGYLDVVESSIKKIQGFKDIDVRVRVSDDPELIVGPKTYHLSAVENDGNGGLIVYIHEAFMLNLIADEKGRRNRTSYNVTPKGRELLKTLAMETAREYIELNGNIDNAIHSSEYYLPEASDEYSKFEKECVSEYLKMKAMSPAMNLGADEIIKRLHAMDMMDLKFDLSGEKIERNPKFFNGRLFRHLLNSFGAGWNVSIKESKRNQFADTIIKLRQGSLELIWALNVIDENQKRRLLDAKIGRDLTQLQNTTMGTLYEKLNKMSELHTLKMVRDMPPNCQEMSMRYLIPLDPRTFRIIGEYIANQSGSKYRKYSSNFSLNDLKPQRIDSPISLGFNVTTLIAYAAARFAETDPMSRISILLSDASVSLGEKLVAIFTWNPDLEVADYYSREKQFLVSTGLCDEVKVWNSDTIQKDDWALATIEMKDGKRIFHVHSALMSQLSREQDELRQKMLLALIHHEVYEAQCLADASRENPESALGAAFKEFMAGTNDGHIPAVVMPDDFHLFLKQKPDIVTRLAPQLADQNELMEYASTIATAHASDMSRWSALLEVSRTSSSFGYDEKGIFYQGKDSPVFDALLNYLTETNSTHKDDLIIVVRSILNLHDGSLLLASTEGMITEDECKALEEMHKSVAQSRTRANVQVMYKRNDIPDKIVAVFKKNNARERFRNYIESIDDARIGDKKTIFRGKKKALLHRLVGVDTVVMLHRVHPAIGINQIINMLLSCSNYPVWLKEMENSLRWMRENDIPVFENRAVSEMVRRSPGEVRTWSVQALATVHRWSAEEPGMTLSSAWRIVSSFEELDSAETWKNSMRVVVDNMVISGAARDRAEAWRLCALRGPQDPEGVMSTEGYVVNEQVTDSRPSWKESLRVLYDNDVSFHRHISGGYIEANKMIANEIAEIFGQNAAIKPGDAQEVGNNIVLMSAGSIDLMYISGSITRGQRDTLIMLKNMLKIIREASREDVPHPLIDSTSGIFRETLRESGLASSGLDENMQALFAKYSTLKDRQRRISMRHLLTPDFTRWFTGTYCENENVFWEKMDTGVISGMLKGYYNMLAQPLTVTLQPVKAACSIEKKIVTMSDESPLTSEAVAMEIPSGCVAAFFAGSSVLGVQAGAPPEGSKPLVSLSCKDPLDGSLVVVSAYVKKVSKDKTRCFLTDKRGFLSPDSHRREQVVQEAVTLLAERLETDSVIKTRVRKAGFRNEDLKTGKFVMKSIFEDPQNPLQGLEVSPSGIPKDDGVMNPGVMCVSKVDVNQVGPAYAVTDIPQHIRDLKRDGIATVLIEHLFMPERPSQVREEAVDRKDKRAANGATLQTAGSFQLSEALKQAHKEDAKVWFSLKPALQVQDDEVCQAVLKWIRMGFDGATLDLSGRTTVSADEIISLANAAKDARKGAVIAVAFPEGMPEQELVRCAAAGVLVIRRVQYGQETVPAGDSSIFLDWYIPEGERLRLDDEGQLREWIGHLARSGVNCVAIPDAVRWGGEVGEGGSFINPSPGERVMDLTYDMVVMFHYGIGGDSVRTAGTFRYLSIRDEGMASSINPDTDWTISECLVPGMTGMVMKARGLYPLVMVYRQILADKQKGEAILRAEAATGGLFAWLDGTLNNTGGISPQGLRHLESLKADFIRSGSTERKVACTLMMLDFVEGVCAGRATTRYLAAHKDGRAIPEDSCRRKVIEDILCAADIRGALASSVEADSTAISAVKACLNDGNTPVNAFVGPIFSQYESRLAKPGSLSSDQLRDKAIDFFSVYFNAHSLSLPEAGIPSERIALAWAIGEMLYSLNYLFDIPVQKTDIEKAGAAAMKILGLEEILKAA